MCKKENDPNCAFYWELSGNAILQNANQPGGTALYKNDGVLVVSFRG